MAYESAVAIDASSADAWYNLGNLYVELNRDQKAVHAYGLAAEHSVQGDAIYRAARKRQQAVINKIRRN